MLPAQAPLPKTISILHCEPCLIPLSIVPPATQNQIEKRQIYIYIYKETSHKIKYQKQEDINLRKVSTTSSIITKPWDPQKMVWKKFYTGCFLYSFSGNKKQLANNGRHEVIKSKANTRNKLLGQPTKLNIK